MGRRKGRNTEYDVPRHATGGHPISDTERARKREASNRGGKPRKRNQVVEQASGRKSNRERRRDERRQLEQKRQHKFPRASRPASSVPQS